MSAGFLVGPFNGTGFINEIVNNTTSHGIVWVNSAGNYAQRHWEGPFNDTDGNKIHNFTPTDENMSITLTSIGDISIFLSWDDWPASNQDYDLCVSNTTGLIVCSENAQNGIQEPVEFLIGTNLPPDTYNFTIVKFNATRNVTFQLYSPLHDLKYQVPKSSLGIPADSQEAIAVGATRLNDSLEIFSSRGPTIDNRTKPDVVAPDGVSTSVILRFFGTSASAPHVAGAAALLLQAAKKKWF
jgi:subtilisin family serine protease